MEHLTGNIAYVGSEGDKELDVLRSVNRELNLVIQVHGPEFEGSDLASWGYVDVIILPVPKLDEAVMEFVRVCRQEGSNLQVTPLLLHLHEAALSELESKVDLGVFDCLDSSDLAGSMKSLLDKYLGEESDVPEPLLERDFRFDGRLDVAYLDKLYGENASYACGLFQIFLDTIDKEWDKIVQALELKDWNAVKSQVHKVKPNFSMVGLTWLTRDMQEVYDMLLQEKHLDVPQRLKQIEEAFASVRPIIDAEYRRLAQNFA